MVRKSTGWMEKALCVNPAQIEEASGGAIKAHQVEINKKQDIYFPDGPENRHNTSLAKKVCELCVVRSDCLEYAHESADSFRAGVYGGTNARERREQARISGRIPPAAPRRNGTPFLY